MVTKSLLLTLIAIMMVGCGPAMVPPIEEIATNETAFLVPLEGDTNKQSSFMSVGFLEKAKVAAKRVTFTVRKRSTGRMPFDYEWLPTMKLIKVSRAPVTREWTDSSVTGTTNKNESLSVESLDSIGFAVGVNLTAMIEENDAALFLNKYAGKPLASVVDTDVRGFVLTVAADEFGSRSLQDCKAQKKVIFDKIRSLTTTHFKKFGVTISNLGHSEGLTYLNPNIQAAIDGAYVQEMDRAKATQEQEAQKIRNKTNISIAVAEKRKAQEFAKAAKAQKSMVMLDIARIKAEAFKILAQKWNGAYPEKMMPEGASLLYGMNESK